MTSEIDLFGEPPNTCLPDSKLVITSASLGHRTSVDDGARVFYPHVPPSRDATFVLYAASTA